jgi:hypothetical protein
MKPFFIIIIFLHLIGNCSAETGIDLKLGSNIKDLSGSNDDKVKVLKSILLEIQNKQIKYYEENRIDLALASTSALTAPYQAKLIQLAKDRSVTVRALSAIIIGYASPSPSIVNALNSLAVDEDKEVRYLAYTSIQLINQPTYETKAIIIKSFPAGIENPHFLESLISTAALWNMREAIEPLKAVLKEANIENRELAAAGLRHLYKNNPSELTKLEGIPFNKLFYKQVSELITNVARVEKARAINQRTTHTTIVDEHTLKDVSTTTQKVALKPEFIENPKQEIQLKSYLYYAVLGLIILASYLIFVFRKK